MRGTLEHEKTDEIMRNDLIERDLNRLVYVGSIGSSDCPMGIMCGEMDCACRYHMRYTRGYGRGGGDWAPLEALFADKVEIQRDILDKQLVEENVSEGEKRQIQIELGIINKRWGSDGAHCVDREKRPLSTSPEWGRHSFGIKYRLGGLA